MAYNFCLSSIAATLLSYSFDVSTLSIILPFLSWKILLVTFILPFLFTVSVLDFSLMAYPNLDMINFGLSSIVFVCF
jgi:hypothetical protein